MKAYTATLFKRTTLVSLLTDISALAFIGFVPAISHLLNVPLYLIEPMRMMLILAIVHTGRNNAYLLAITMPLFSWMISGHPVPPKMLLIMLELYLNVYLFHVLLKNMKLFFPAMFLGIVLSKSIYYLLKFGLIQLSVIGAGLFATPLLIQLATALLFSLYLSLFYRENS
jgi:hypothetical protein